MKLLAIARPPSEGWTRGERLIRRKSLDHSATLAAPLSVRYRTTSATLRPLLSSSFEIEISKHSIHREASRDPTVARSVALRGKFKLAHEFTEAWVGAHAVEPRLDIQEH